MNRVVRTVKIRRGWVPLAALFLGLLIGVAGTAWILRPVDLPRPSAPRATATNPCADCAVLPPSNTLGAVVGELVTDSVRRPTIGICPAGYRGAGKLGSDGVCRSETTFRVEMELLAGTYRVPDQAPVARCEIGSDARFPVVSVRYLGSAHIGARAEAPIRDETESSCDAVRRAQPELANAAFEVHQLVWLQRYSAETLDTATNRIVEPLRTIGYRRTPTLNVVGVAV